MDDQLRWGNRSNHAALNVLPTAPNEMFIDTNSFRRRSHGMKTWLEATVTFSVPADVAGQNVRFAAFVGQDFQSTPQQIQSAPVK